jgi:hypothetical protein
MKRGSTHLHDRVGGHPGFHHEAEEQHHKGRHDAQPVEYRQCVLSPKPGTHQVHLEGRDLAVRRRNARTDLVKQADQGAGLRFFVGVDDVAVCIADDRFAQLAHEPSRLVDQAVSDPCQDQHQHQKRAGRE